MRVMQFILEILIAVQYIFEIIIAHEASPRIWNLKNSKALASSANRKRYDIIAVGARRIVGPSNAKLIVLEARTVPVAGPELRQRSTDRAREMRFDFIYLWSRGI